MTAPKSLAIDFVSDVVCPWCAIGLRSLEIALERLSGQVQAQIRIQPFQLNPAMPPEGEDIVEHLSRKYGMGAEQVRANQDAIAKRGEAVGFEFRMDRRGRTWNTFDAHRLLHWAGLDGHPSANAHDPSGRQLALKHALLRAYFAEGENPASCEVLLRCAAGVGLDADAARSVLDGDAHADEVRALLARYAGLGISAVPSVIVEQRWLIQGGQPPETFEQSLRQIAESP